MTTRVTGERGDHIYSTAMEMGMVRVIEMLGNRKIRDVLVGLQCEADFHEDVRNLADKGGYRWIGEETRPELQKKLLSGIIGSLNLQVRKRRREEMLASFEHAVICTRAAYRHCGHWKEKTLIRLGTEKFLFVPSKFAFTHLEITFVYTPIVTYNELLGRYEVTDRLSITEPGSGRRVGGGRRLGGNTYKGEKQTRDESIAKLLSLRNENILSAILSVQMLYDFPETKSHDNEGNDI